jgi:hypothetical protein
MVERMAERMAGRMAERMAGAQKVKIPNRKRCLNPHNQIFELLDMQNAWCQEEVLTSRDLSQMCRWGKSHQHSQNSCKNIHR